MLHADSLMKLNSLNELEKVSESFDFGILINRQPIVVTILTDSFRQYLKELYNKNGEKVINFILKLDDFEEKSPRNLVEASAEKFPELSANELAFIVGASFRDPDEEDTIDEEEESK